MVKKKRVFHKKKKKNFKYKTLILTTLSTLLIGVFTLILFMPELREIIVAFILRAFFFVKTKLWVFISGFFLVKGKFVLKLFAKKLILILPIGLGKRYFIEKVFMKNLKEYYFDKLPIWDFFSHSKKNFLEFSLVKRLTAFLTIVFSALIGINFLGDFVFIKVILAKMWSFLLLIFMKLGTLVYIFILDSTWIRYLLEIIFLGWFVSLLEKNNWIANKLNYVYNAVGYVFDIINDYLHDKFNKPTQKGLNKLTIKTSKWMHRFIGTEGYITYRDFILRKRVERISEYALLHEWHKDNPSYYKTMKEKKESRFTKLKKNRKINNRDKIISKRKKYCNITKYLFLHKEHKLEYKK